VMFLDLIILYSKESTKIIVNYISIFPRPVPSNEYGKMFCILT